VKPGSGVGVKSAGGAEWLAVGEDATVALVGMTEGEAQEEKKRKRKREKRSGRIAPNIEQNVLLGRLRRDDNPALKLSSNTKQSDEGATLSAIRWSVLLGISFKQSPSGFTQIPSVPTTLLLSII